MIGAERATVRLRRSGREAMLELLKPLPDAVVLPHEMDSLDLPPGTPTGEYMSRLYLKAPERPGEVQLHEEDPSFTGVRAPSMSRERCSDCGRDAPLLYVRAQTTDETRRAARLCEECYALQPDRP